ncbi:MAG: ATP-binding protein [Candidatus Brocadiales bacterium]|nr:ATP-binding protein [Candidatus Bathyanammoxibius amoris]
MRKPSLSVRSRLLIFGLCISLIPIAIITTIYYFNARRALKQQIMQSLTAIAESKKAHVIELIEGRKGRVTDFASDGHIKDSLETINRNEFHKDDVVIALNRHLLTNKKLLGPYIRGIEAVDLDGKVVASTNEAMIGRDISDQEIFTQARDKNYNEAGVVPPHNGHYINTAAVDFSAPVTSRDGVETLGLIINHYDLAILSEITANRAGMGKTGEIVLGQMEEDNNIVFLNFLRYADNAPLTLSIPLTSKEAEPMRLALEGKSGALIAPDYRGVKVVAAYQYIPSLDWGLVAKIDEAEALAPLRTLGIVALIVGLLSAAAVISTVVIFAYSRLMFTETPAEAPGAPTGEATGGIRPFRSIKARLLTFVLCISLIPVILLTTIYYLNARHALKKQALEWLTAVAESRRLHIVSYLEKEKKHAVHFSRDRFIRESLAMIERGGPDRENAMESLNRYLSSEEKISAPELLAIMVADMDGEILASSDSKLLGQDIRDLNVFTEARGLNSGQAYIGQPRYLSYLGKNVLFFSAPIAITTNGDTIGVIVNANSLSSLSDITSSRAGMGGTGEVYLGRTQGSRIVFLSSLRYVHDAPLSLSVPVGSVGAEPMRLALEGKSGALVAPDYRGVDVVAAYQGIPSMDWGLVAKVDKSEAFAPIRLQGIIALAVGVIGAAVVTCLGFIFALSTSRPIRKLTYATRRFAGGDLGSRVKIRRRDEIGELASSFNVMAEGFDREITERKEAEGRLAEQVQLAKLGEAVGVALTREETLRNMLQECTEAIVLHLNVVFTRVWTLNKDENVLELQASSGMYTRIDGRHSRVAVGGGLKIGVIAQEKRPFLTNDLANEPWVSDRDWVERERIVAFAGYPLVVEGRAVGVIATFARKPMPGHVLGALAAATDEIALGIKHKKTEEEIVKRSAELAEANVRLRELDRLKSMFVASMSHELRTPLNSIIGFTGILLRGIGGEINEQQKDDLSRVKRSAKHLLSLINDVIDISKVEAGKAEAFVEEFTLDEVISEAIESVQPQIKEKGLALEQSVSPGIRLKTDRKRLLQCILNYLSNAVKFTEAGTISIAAQEINGEVEITVTDTGIGIAKEDLPKLFNAFVRLDSAVRTKILGTGLGLYLTGKLAREVLGGTVAAWSEPGRGSTFTLRVPKELKQKQA